MIAKIARLFQSRDPRREATLALARINTLSGMRSLPWDSGVCDDRRTAHEVRFAVGAWLAPIDDGESPDQASRRNAQHAVCCDLRAEGVGVVTSEPLDGHAFLVGVPNGDESCDSWKFFVATRCHQTQRPGQLFVLGLRVERVWELTSPQMQDLRQLIEDDSHAMQLA